jgi:hypothetical protein
VVDHRTAGVRGCEQRLYPGKSAPFCILDKGHIEPHKYQPDSEADARAAAIIASKAPDLARAQAMTTTAVCGANLHERQPRCYLPEGHTGGHLYSSSGQPPIEPEMQERIKHQLDGEAGERLIRGHTMTIGEAVELLKMGKRVARAGWNGRGMWLGLQVPDEHSKMGLPYVYMSTVGGKLVPWLCSQTDLLAEDWEVVS